MVCQYPPLWLFHRAHVSLAARTCTPPDFIFGAFRRMTDGILGRRSDNINSDFTEEMQTGTRGPHTGNWGYANYIWRIKKRGSRAHGHWVRVLGGGTLLRGTVNQTQLPGRYYSTLPRMSTGARAHFHSQGARRRFAPWQAGRWHTCHPRSVSAPKARRGWPAASRLDLPGVSDPQTSARRRMRTPSSSALEWVKQEIITCPA